jgi:hypothetical protein
MGDAANKKHAAAKAEGKHAVKGKPIPPKSRAKHAAPASHGKSASAKKRHARK